MRLDRRQLVVLAVVVLGIAVQLALLWPLRMGPDVDEVHRLADERLQRRLGVLGDPWHGDLPEIRDERRFLRVLVSYSRTNFFVDGDAVRGLEYEMMLAFEDHLNRNAARPEDRVALVFVPVPFADLLDALEDGRGDVVAAGLTVTPERADRVAFSRPYMTGVREVVVQGPDADHLDGLDDLSGRRVHVVAGSSYARHLGALDAVRVREAAPYMEIGDVLELVEAGAWDYTVADLHLARAWAGALPDLTVREDLAVHEGGRVAWAVRKDNPRLLAALNRFARTVRQGSFLGNVLTRRYLTAGEHLVPPDEDDGLSRFRTLEPVFRKYAEEFGFDWLRLAALAYQESRFHQDKTSHAGAVGVMQVLPATARSVGIPAKDIRTVEGNIEAGVRYLAHLRDQVFDDGDLSRGPRMNFITAAYNAGPTRVRELRREAARQGLDPDRWFGNVEHLASRTVGRETVDYVLAVNKYYVLLAGLADYMTRREVEDAD